MILFSKPPNEASWFIKKIHEQKFTKKSLQFDVGKNSHQNEVSWFMKNMNKNLLAKICKKETQL